MATIPQFQPAAESGSGFLQSNNLMMRGMANRRAEESAEMERVKFEIMRPIMESEARVQLASSGNELQATQIINDSIAGDLTRFPQYVQDWTRTATIEDPKERLNERRRILGAITPFAAIKSTAPMVKAFQEQYAQDANSDKTADMLVGRLEVTGAQNEAKLAKTTADNEAKIRVAEANIAQREAALKAQEERMKIQQEHQRQMEETKAGHAQELEKIRGEGKAASAEAAMRGRGENTKQKAALDANEKMVAETGAATADVEEFQQALTLLNDPAVRTGTGAEFETAVRRLGSIGGADVSKVKNLEQLQSILGTTFLERARSMKGSLSDKDVATLQRITPGIGKSNEGNIAILNVLVQKRARDVEIAKIIQEGRRSGETEREIQMDVNDFLLENPLGAFAPVQGGVQIKSIKRVD